MSFGKNILYAIGACFLWSQVFILPLVFENIPALWLIFGRCMVYGCISTFIVLTSWTRIKPLLFNTLNHDLNWPLIKHLLLLALVANVLHYLALVIGLRYADPSIATLILSMNPIAVSLYSNVEEKKFSIKTLSVPLAVIGLGLMFLYLPSEPTSFARYEMMMACVFGLIALATWTWFIVKNNSFFKQHLSLSPQDWVTLLGLTTGFWMVMSTCLYLITNHEHFFIDIQEKNVSLMSWLVASVILGAGSSWAAHFLWVSATQTLSLTLAGLLTTLESIFGLLFIFAWQHSLPSFMHLTGLSSIFLGIALAIYFLRNEEHMPIKTN